VQQKFGDQVNIVGVAGRDDLRDMEEFVSRTGVEGFDHIADEDSEIWTIFGVTSQPAFVFINDDGTTETLISALGVDGLTERIEALAAA
jgi:hypothetical protein